MVEGLQMAVKKLQVRGVQEILRPKFLALKEIKEEALHGIIHICHKKAENEGILGETVAQEVSAQLNKMKLTRNEGKS